VLAVVRVVVQEAGGACAMCGTYINKILMCGVKDLSLACQLNLSNDV
jgi:hypothetical protein